MKPVRIGFNAVGKPVDLYSEKRKFHHHIIGSSGSGKSKFLEILLRGEIASGQGFCLIDPHGSLYDDVLKYCAFFGVKRKIILLNLSAPDLINGFNLFSKDKTGDVSVQVDNRVNATLHAWNAENADTTPTLERILRLIYTTLLDADLTLPQVATLLDYKEKKIRDELIAKIENDLVRSEWQEISDLPKAREFRDEILSAKNRLFRFLTSKTLMRFLGLKGQTIDLFEAMNKGTIILVNLAQSEHLSKENARVFGALLVNQFFEAAVRRKDAATRRPYRLYLDEFQKFVSLDLADMLDEIRKFSLFLTLSHQRYGQIGEDMEDAILTNCRIKTVFGGLRTEDAKRMAEELFIGKLDPKKIKVAIYQTKHWYKYTRDKVYSRSSGYTESEGSGTGFGTGLTSGMATGAMSGQTMIPPSDDAFTGAAWFDAPEIKAISESASESFSAMESSSSFQSESRSTSYSESESVADIPVFVPVPYQELSSLQYYTTEEQLLELTQALKLQQQRHCFIQLPDEETQPLLVPFVQDFYITPRNIKRYVERISKDAITPEEADRQILHDIQELSVTKNSAETKAIPSATVSNPPVKAKQKSIFVMV
jgi:hypothetical protein